MIESEEVFESAQETGYRLCSSGPNSTVSCNYFSASWDANDPDRLLVCAQDGQLRVINSRTNSERHYRIKFKPFSTADTHVPRTSGRDAGSSESSALDSSSGAAKSINAHWDKMTTIPDRPDEIIFLLGITKVRERNQTSNKKRQTCSYTFPHTHTHTHTHTQTYTSTFPVPLLYCATGSKHERALS